MSQVTAIRITDAFIIRRVTEEQERTGESTATKTAARLLNERLAQLEAINPKFRGTEPSVVGREAESHTA